MSGDVAAAVVVGAVDRWIDTVLMQRALGAGDDSRAVTKRGGASG